MQLFHSFHISCYRMCPLLKSIRFIFLKLDSLFACNRWFYNFILDKWVYLARVPHIYISISHHLKRITPFYDFQLNLPRYDSLHYYVLMFVFCFFDYRVSIYLKTKELNFGTQLNCLNMNASLSLIFNFFFIR